MKHSFRRVIDFANVATPILTAIKKSREDGNTPKGETKLSYAMDRVAPQADKRISNMQEHLGRIDVKHCLTDEKKEILRDEQGKLRYLKSELEKCQAEKFEAMDVENQEIDPFYVKEIPPGYSDSELQALVGFVITQETLDNYRREKEIELGLIELDPELRRTEVLEPTVVARAFSAE